MTVVSVTFTCSRCRREVKEIDDGNAVVHEMFPGGASRAHMACRSCRQMIRTNNSAMEITPKPAAPLPGASRAPQPVQNATPQQDALAMVAQALLQLSKQNDQIIALLSKPHEKVDIGEVIEQAFAEEDRKRASNALKLLNDPIIAEEDDG